MKTNTKRCIWNNFNRKPDILTLYFKQVLEADMKAAAALEERNAAALEIAKKKEQ